MLGPGGNNPMSTYPRLEARISAQERRQTILDARIEELSEDMTTSIQQLSSDMKASFKQLADYQIQAERQIDVRFSQVDTRFDKIETRIDKLEMLLTQILERLPEKP